MKLKRAKSQKSRNRWLWKR